MTYEAFVLTNSARETVLAAFEPKYGDVIAHHVTHRFGVPKNPTGGYGDQSVVTVVGYAHEPGIEALVVHVDGQATRPDGKLYHVTLSLDREQGKKPQMSNEVIARGYRKVDPFDIVATFTYV